MKVRILVCIITLSLAVPVWAEEREPLKDKRDRVSYTIGVDIGRLLKKELVDVNLDVFKEAVKDVLSGAKLALTEDEIAEIRSVVGKDIGSEKEKNRQALAEQNKAEEEKFLAANKNKEGIVTLPSGLQYKVINTGAGQTPKEDDLVSVHYRVSLLDGTEIESSYAKNAPATFDLENVIQGWREGAQLMQTGSKWRFFIPSNLAYGEDGVGEFLGPNIMLIFDLELLKILDKSKENPAEESQEKGAE
ncbi:MAG: FKBP-type peptidyl-prolyl cis-trans isomerase [Syntrophobacterales bacterium]|nr:FKBP-type peptidyl-prolyl cis-trans isomerase [Syntrophobacterales bacterium]